ncbi:MAG: hypothetical protein R3D58_13710 [Saprospiraceae bacterium]
MDYRLSEHSRLEVGPLPPGDVRHLQRQHAGHIALRPGVGDSWVLQSNHHVGVIKLPSGSRIVVASKVPVQNLLFMVAHTYDLVHFNKHQSRHGLQDEKTIADVYVHVLLSWLELLIRKGLYKAYVPTVNATPAIKGKFLIDQNLNSTTRFWCEYDDLTFSTQVNRILKSSLRHIIQQVPVSASLRSQALTYFRLLHPIDEVALSAKIFRQVDYNRLNHHYQTLIDLCALIYTNSSLRDSGDGQAFSGFMANMNRVFEQFMLKFIKQQMSGVRVSGGKKSNWAESFSADSYLPDIEPDIHIHGRYLIDTKYYTSPLNERGKLHSSHLYQMLTYMRAYGLNGMLLYPKNEVDVDVSYLLEGQYIRVRAVDLGGSLEKFQAELLGLISDIRETFSRANHPVLP